MEELVGGSLSLEQRYDLVAHVGTFGGVDVFEGVQRPLGRPIWIHVMAHPERGNPTTGRNWVDRVRSAVLTSAQSGEGFYDVIDFGDVDHGIPFIVYERDPEATRLSELVEEEGALEGDRVASVSAQLASLVNGLTERGRSHGALHPAFVFLGKNDAVHLVQTGLGITRHELEQLGSSDLFGLFSFPPDEVLDQASHSSADDAFGVAAIAYYCVSGMHPFLSPGGALLGSKPRPLQEFGLDDRFSDAIEAQFVEATRDLDLLLSAPSPARVHVVEPTPDVDSEVELAPSETRASPLATMLAAAVVVLLISNVLVFIWALKPRPIEPQPDGAPTAVLPQGLKLETSPVDVKVIDAITRKELGQTPLTLDPRISDGVLELELSARGYQTEKITFSLRDEPKLKMEMRPETTTGIAP